eukprot:1160428-Pelagomonas_calceolata.AAC.21
MSTGRGNANLAQPAQQLILRTHHYICVLRFVSPRIGALHFSTCIALSAKNPCEVSYAGACCTLMQA